MPEMQFRTIHQIVKAAKMRLNQTSWDYLIGGTETETSLKRNRMAIESLAIRPRVLNDVNKVDTSGTILGQTLKMPVLLAPIGSLQVFEEGGGASAAIAAAEAGIMSIKSSVCEPSLEEVAAASDAPKIFQLYVRGDDDYVDGIIQRVVDSEYKAFCLTVDSAVISRRERDIAKNVVPTSQSSGHGDFSYQSGLNWSDVRRIRDKWDIPLILKGIQCVEDAVKAVEYGVDVVYISNHGGRQIDQAEGSISILPEIATEVGDKAEIIVDGGFYRGTDIVKAIALGANAVGVGRLEGWAMAAGGAPAVVNCMQILRHEIRLALALSGVTSFGELDASYVTQAPPVALPSVFSAFPLLNQEDEGY
tara:strand:- start:170 stop:1255 length:1086 start_codon:yes stop_codon:yes gene_type:complete